MKKIVTGFRSLFIFLIFFSGSLSARPLIVVLDGGQEREKENPTFNEVIEYAAAARNIPCIVSGSILQQYDRFHGRGLEHLFNHFFCFKHTRENLFILTPMETPFIYAPTLQYSEYELGVGLQCDHKNICSEILSVDDWYALLRADTKSSACITFDPTVITSLLIPASQYGNEKPSPWVMYVGGHGYYDSHEHHSVISGIQLPVFRRFVENIMQHHECGMMLLDTCHAGGRQAQRVMNHMTQCEQRFGAQKSFSMVIIGLTHDLLYSSRFPAVRSALNYYFHKNHCDASREALSNLKVIDFALHGFSNEALHSRSSWHRDRLVVTRNFYKISKTPQVRVPGGKAWEVFPLGTSHVLSVDNKNQHVVINENVVAVLIKKGAIKPHIEFNTRTRSLFISELDDNQVCSIHHVEASKIELEDFLRYGFFDLIEPHSRLVFCIDSLRARDAGTRVDLTDVLIIKERGVHLVGIFGYVFFKAYGSYYKATVGCFPAEHEKEPQFPVHAVESLDINVSEIAQAEYMIAWNKYRTT